MFLYLNQNHSEKKRKVKRCKNAVSFVFTLWSPQLIKDIKFGRHKNIWKKSRHLIKNTLFVLRHTGWRKFSLEKQKESFVATKTAGRSLNVSLEILYFISKKTARKCPDMLLKVPSLVATITLLHQQKDV